MTRPVRRFTTAGILAAEALIERIRLEGDADVESLLESEEITEQLDHEIEVCPFANRFEAAEHLHKQLAPLGPPQLLGRDKGLWTWLALSWIDHLAPPVLGKRSVRATPRWVLAADDYSRYYRHLLAGPYYVYAAHVDDPSVAMAVLATPVERPGEIVEQFASRQMLVTSRGVMGALTRLYYDSGSGKLRKGSAGKDAGSARRFAMLLQQLDLTYDIYEMSADELLELLPPEFDRFRTPPS